MIDWTTLNDCYNYNVNDPLSEIFGIKQGLATLSQNEPILSQQANPLSSWQLLLLE